jgi:hypothetical protein
VGFLLAEGLNAICKEMFPVYWLSFVPSLGYDCFLLNPSEFIILESFWHFTLIYSSKKS